MGKLMRKSRLILAVVLLAQTVTLFFLFILQVTKRRSLAQAFLAVAAFEATAGGYLLWQICEEEKEQKESAKIMKEMSDLPQDFEVPLDEKASEREFR